jgi:hypothetical protein
MGQLATGPPGIRKITVIMWVLTLGLRFTTPWQPGHAQRCSASSPR